MVCPRFVFLFFITRPAPNFLSGIVSGIVGGFGNLGGIIFAIIFRYSHHDYARGIWILGVISMAANIAVAWIRPVPKSQMRE